MTKMQHSNKQLEGLLFGFLGVLGFSFTLPATRMALETLHPVVVGLGRALVAACFAALLLWVTQQKKPTKQQWKRLSVVMLGAIAGFPILTAWAMQFVPATHGAVVLGILPLATASIGALRAHEHPSWAFWAASAMGSVIVVGFALAQGGGGFHVADVALLLAVLSAAAGYAEGGHLARELGGWQTICWALVLSFPVLVWPVGFAIWEHGFTLNSTSLFGFGYVCSISMFLGFLAWFHGLALGGVARISQLQLLQPFMTLGLAALFLNESLSASAIIGAGLVALSIVVGRKGLPKNTQHHQHNH